MKRLQICLLVSLAMAFTHANAQQAAADATVRAPAPATVDPAVAAAEVTKALQAANGVPARGISVATHASTVVLTGEVDTEAQRAAVLTVAEKAAGGVRVTSNVQVRPPEQRSPTEQLAAQQSAQLVRDVDSAIKADARTANLGITISTADASTVVLQGLVPSHETRSAVQAVASGVKGVKRVDNRLLAPGDPVPAANPR